MHRINREFNEARARKGRGLASFAGEESGAVAIIFAVTIIVIFGVAALAIDLGRLQHAKVNAQSAADAAILAGVQKANSALLKGQSEQEAKQAAEEHAKLFFAANREKLSYVNNAVFTPIVTIAGAAVSGSGTVKSNLETTVAKAIGFTVMRLDVVAEVSLVRAKQYEVHFIVDVSASMGIGASDGDIDIMARSIGCAFACHVPPGVTTWTDTLAPARSAGATLRIDVVKNAIRDMIGSGASVSEIKFAGHAFSNTAWTFMRSTDDPSVARAAVAALDMTADWGQGGTNFSRSLREVASLVGTSGDGLSETNPIKIAILVTDGVATNIRFAQGAPSDVSNDPAFVEYAPTFNQGGPNSAWLMNGFDPDTCEPLKRQGVELYALHTKYVFPKVGTDGDSRFSMIDSGLKSDIQRHMRACASDDKKAYEATNARDIAKAFNDIRDEISKSVLRLSR